MSPALAVPKLDNKTKRFMKSKVVKNERTGCWDWNGGIQGKGYGAIYIKGVMYRVHRLFYSLANGEPPKGKLICHKCDNKKCVNPSHLYAGTHKDNTADAIKSGLIYNAPKRMRYKNLSTKVKKNVLIDYESGMSRIKLSKKYNFSYRLVTTIVKNYMDTVKA